MGEPERRKHQRLLLQEALRFLVSMALIVGAYIADLPRDTIALIIGAVVGYWLREGEALGRDAISRVRSSRGTGGEREGPSEGEP